MTGISVLAIPTYLNVVFGYSPKLLQSLVVHYRCQPLGKAIPDYQVAGEYAGYYLTRRRNGNLPGPTAIMAPVEMKGVLIGPEISLNDPAGELRREIAGLYLLGTPPTGRPDRIGQLILNSHVTEEFHRQGEIVLVLLHGDDSHPHGDLIISEEVYSRHCLGMAPLGSRDPIMGLGFGRIEGSGDMHTAIPQKRHVFFLEEVQIGEDFNEYIPLVPGKVDQGEEAFFKQGLPADKLYLGAAEISCLKHDKLPPFRVHPVSLWRREAVTVTVEAGKVAPGGHLQPDKLQRSRRAILLRYVWGWKGGIGGFHQPQLDHLIDECTVPSLDPSFLERGQYPVG